MDVSGTAENTASEAKGAESTPTVTETWNGEQYTVIKEGQAKILYPAGHQVFYNPVQEYNRDMSVMMLRLFAEEWNGKGMPKK